ncbi:alginate lyase family protein [Paludibacter jiangxiensis]|uniref:Alginate lyase n=1 Tax=Paludibacter jiangxiensis TaxID=681398 RepID=A0A170Y603_9BACT|nr:alginate lyase family protein [Paludibacter jiangxiensis]GAT61544.1 alginate lyase [Paludibacter jiangxiensis]
MKQLLIIFLLGTCISGFAIPPHTELWDEQKLKAVKMNLRSNTYRPAYETLIRRAEQALLTNYRTVMDKAKTPPSGSKHDYMSLAIYFWPDSTKKDGVPYVNRDGIRNPELKKFDAEPKSEMIDGVVTLSLADYFSGDAKYGDAAAKLLDKWFLDPATRMNPNLDYAQHIPGICDGRGIGIIDTYNFVSLTDAIRLLHESGRLSESQFAGLKQWFFRFTDWLLESKNGRDESVTRNNHGTAYDVQLTACALFSGKNDVAMKTMRQFAERRMFKQIEPDGSQPLELSRTLAFHYSWYNVTHIIDMAAIAKHHGVDIVNAVSSDGRSLDKALGFLTDYIGRQNDWKWKQIHGWDMVEQELCEELRKVASVGGDLKYEKQREVFGKTAPDDILLMLFPM